jgi:hypothetical protein
MLWREDLGEGWAGGGGAVGAEMGGAGVHAVNQHCQLGACGDASGRGAHRAAGVAHDDLGVARPGWVDLASGGGSYRAVVGGG